MEAVVADAVGADEVADDASIEAADDSVEVDVAEDEAEEVVASADEVEAAEEDSEAEVDAAVDAAAVAPDWEAVATSSEADLSLPMPQLIVVPLQQQNSDQLGKLHSVWVL